MQRIRRSGVGQNLVEFALVGPLFFFLIFGVLEGGRLVWTHHTLSNATKEGARYATVRGSGSIHADAPVNSLSVEDHMIDLSTGLDAAVLEVDLTLLDGNMQDRSRFHVEAAYEFDFILTSLFGLDGITLEAESTDMFWRNAED